MSNSVNDGVPRRHHVLPDIGRPVMAKADVRDLDNDWILAIGRVIQQAVSSAGLSNKEAAARVGVDDAEFGKWLNGTRRPHLDRVFAVEELRLPLVIGFAELAGQGVEIETVVHVRTVQRRA